MCKSENSKHKYKIYLNKTFEKFLLAENIVLKRLIGRLLGCDRSEKAAWSMGTVKGYVNNRKIAKLGKRQVY